VSRPERRKELQEVFEREQEERRREEARLAARSIWQVIEDAKSVADLKELLHTIAERLELE